ncbi:MAG: BBP7 family outer membrane beta-barrel protein [Pirellulales bacterium]
MVTRTAGGRLGAASALGLLVAWAIVAVTGTARAQQFAERDDFSFADDGQFAPQDEFQQGEVPDYWGADDGACGCECGDTCCDSHMPDLDCPCGCRANETSWWFASEYLIWKTDSTHLPALVTDSPIGTEPTLDSPATQVLTATKVADSWRSGYRLEMGIWFDDCNTLALVGDYFNIGNDDYDYFYPGDSGRNTGRPFFNTQTGVQDVQRVAGTYDEPLMQPDTVRDGTIAVTADDEFQGTGLTIEQCVYSVGDRFGFGPGTQVILLGGYRFYGYDSRLAITDTTSIISGDGAGGFDTHRDVFTSDNEFHGGEIGVRARFTQQACWFDGMFKIALGGHRRTVTINGATVNIPAGGPADFSEGGLLTSSETNIGEYSNSRARLIPEFRLGIGVFLAPQWTFRAGCSAIVWSGVVRAADGLPPNLAVDERNIPPGAGTGGVSPVFSGLGGSELVATGLDLGFEYNY